MSGSIYDEDRGLVMFSVLDNGKPVTRAISREPLEDRHGAQHSEIRQAFIRNRTSIERIAARLIGRGRFEANGSVLIRTTDYSRLRLR